MTTAFYNAMQTVADRQLTDKGAPITFTRTTTGVYDPTTGVAAVILTDYTVNAAVFGFPDKNVNGTNILVGDKRVLISTKGTSYAPAPNDYLFIEGVKHSIIDIKTLAPAGIPVLYTAQARKGG